MRTVEINANDAGQRLDKFLNKYMPSLPNGMLYKGLRKNCVRINGKHAKSGDVMLCEGDVLTLYFKDEFYPKEKTFVGVGYDLDIVYEDENLIVVNKPIGTVAHSAEGLESGLIDEIKSYLYDKGEYNPQNEHSFSPALCSRLDRNTCGLVPCAKNAAALREMNEIIRSRNLIKKYECLCEGTPNPRHDTLRAYLKRNDKFVTVSESGGDDAKEIITEYTVIGEEGSFSKLDIILHTGRTHQIRAHLAYIGHPLAGDKKYGAKIPCEFKYQALKCKSLTFTKNATNGILTYLNGREIGLNKPKK